MYRPRSPCGDRPPGERGALLLLAGLVGGGLALRLIAAALIPLTEDEAYYRLWAQAPAFGYFDHPPMIAWWIWGGVHLVGDTPLGVRLAPIAGCALTSLVVFRLARLAGGDRVAGAWAAILYNVMPLVLAGGLLAVPDAPASLFWTGCLVCVLQAGDRNAWRWWAAAGICAGLAALSKYSALFLPVGIFLWLIASASGRQRLTTPGPWLAALLAAAIFSVNIAWNAAHHWETFVKQFARVAPHGLALRHLPEFLFVQCLLINPLVAALAWRSMKGNGAQEVQREAPLFLAVTCAPFALYLLLHSLHDRVEAHWPAPLYPAVAVLAALAATGPGAGRRWRERAGAVAVGLGAAILAGGLLAIPPGSLIRGLDLSRPVRGWPHFARSLEKERRAVGAQWVGALSYGLAAQLSSRPELRPPVVEIRERERFKGLVAVSSPVVRARGLIVDLPRRAVAAHLERCFVTVAPLGQIPRGGEGDAGVSYDLFLVQGPRRDLLAQGC